MLPWRTICHRCEEIVRTQSHLAVNRNRFDDGNSSCEDISKSVGEGFYLINSWSILVTLLMYSASWCCAMQTEEDISDCILRLLGEM